MSEEYKKVYKGKAGCYLKYPQGDNDKLLAALGYPIWIVALVALFAIKPLSPYLRFHAIQALGLNIIYVVLWIVSMVLASFIIGFCLMPFALGLWIYAIIIAVMLFTGKDHRIWKLGDYVEENYV